MPKLVIFIFSTHFLLHNTNDETNMSIPLQKKESWTSSWVIFSAVEFGNKIEVRVLVYTTY